MRKTTFLNAHKVYQTNQLEYVQNTRHSPFPPTMPDVGRELLNWTHRRVRSSLTLSCGIIPAADCEFCRQQEDLVVKHNGAAYEEEINYTDAKMQIILV